MKHLERIQKYADWLALYFLGPTPKS